MNGSEPDRNKCRVIIDAMGGDFAPLNNVLGAIQAVREVKNIDLFLAGKSDEINRILSEKNLFFKK